MKTPKIKLVWSKFSLDAEEDPIEAVADDEIDIHVDWWLKRAAESQDAETTVYVRNMLVVDAFRVQRKLGNVAELSFHAARPDYPGLIAFEINSDGRWLFYPDFLNATEKYLIDLL